MSQVLPKTALLSDPHEILVHGCLRNDLQCQEQLYRLFYPEMIRICCRYTGDMDKAGSVYNNAMLKVFRGIGNYRHEGRLAAWIRTIVVNCCLDHVKENNHIAEEELRIVHTEQESISSEALSNVSVKEIQRVINTLPPATAAVFNLYVYDGFTHKQISEALGISDGTSKWHVNEGRRILKIKLEHFLNPAVKTNADRK